MARPKAIVREFREPTENEKRFIYGLYELIYDSHFTLPKKRSLMTAALGYETWSWRVIGITEDAIRAIAQCGFKKPPGKLARDHRRSRAETYKATFERKMDFEEWWGWIWENDETILMTNEEHRSQILSKVYALDPRDNYFVDGEVAGWYQTRAWEGALIKRLCEEHGIQY